jgi:hypothetical protein
MERRAKEQRTQGTPTPSAFFLTRKSSRAEFDAFDLVIGYGPPVTQNGLNFTSAINPAYLSSTGSTTDKYGTYPVTAAADLNGTDTAMSVGEGIYLNPIQDMSPYAFTSITFTSSYTVPEPATAGFLAAIAGAALARRRRV